jgi:hypothetical protein
MSSAQPTTRFKFGVNNTAEKIVTPLEVEMYLEK